MGDPTSSGGSAGKSSSTTAGSGGANTAGAATAGSAGASNGAGGALGNGGSTTQIEDPPDLVRGVIVHRGKLVPLANLIIDISGNTVSTDESGRFELRGVPETYDATVFLGERRVHVFKGLTRRNPTLRVNALEPGNKVAAIGGTLSGGVGFPNPTNYRAAVGFLLTPGVANSALVSADRYDLKTSWYSDPKRDLALRALQWSVDLAGMPTGYAGFGTKNVAVTDAAKVDNVQIALGSVESRKLTQVFKIPAGSTPQNWSVKVGPISVISAVPQMSGTAEYTIPKGVDAPIVVSVQADKPLSRGMWIVGNELSTLNTELPAPPTLLVPFEGGLGITNNHKFTWKPFGAGIHEVVFTSEELVATVTLADTTTTMPDLTRFGVPLPKGVSFLWLVRGIAPVTSLDEFSGPEEILDTKKAALEAESALRSFRFAE
jgi:hypothetical protein